MNTKARELSKAEKVRELESRIRQRQDELRQLQNDLEYHHRACKHEWGEPKYDPIVQEGYQTQGDPPGSGLAGSDVHPAPGDSPLDS